MKEQGGRSITGEGWLIERSVNSNEVKKIANQVRVLKDFVLMFGWRSVERRRNGILGQCKGVHKGEEFFSLNPILEDGQRGLGRGMGRT